MMIIEPTNMMVGTGTPWDTMVATGEEKIRQFFWGGSVMVSVEIAG